MKRNNGSKQNSYLGAIHIHSTFSDGTGDIEKITLAARKAGLDWIIVTDHNNFQIREGFINGVCVIKGEEISPNDCNHYLALGINKEISYEQDVQDYVNEVRSQGGFGFSAHPDESLTRKNRHAPIRWLDKNITPDGIEIWNWFSTWADNYCDKNIFTNGHAFLFRHGLITPPKLETLRWWDELNNCNDKIIPAIGGIDAHALKITDYLIPIEIFPYEEMFKTITNVITLEKELSKDFEHARIQILEALKSGHNLVFNRHLCKEIPQISIVDSEDCNCNGVCGTNTYIKIKLKKKFEVRILCNGELVWHARSQKVNFPVTKSGKYRVELGQGKLGYAYSNPVKIQL